MTIHAATRLRYRGFPVKYRSRQEVRGIAHYHELKVVDAFGPFVAFPIVDYIELLGESVAAGRPDYLIVDDAELPMQYAQYRPRDKQFLMRRSIYDAAINEDNPLYCKARFILAHEVGHWALDHDALAFDRSVEGIAISALPGMDSEDQANQFGEELLVSTIRLSRDYDTHFKISDAFAVEETLAKKRIRDLAKENFWSELKR